MSKVITFSTLFPSYHSRAGQPTHFVEKFLSAWDSTHSFQELARTPLIDARIVDLAVLRNCLPKYHTIRAGHRYKKGDMFSPRIWGNDINPKSKRSGPYHSKQIIIAPDTEVSNVWDFKLFSNGKHIEIEIDGKEFAGMEDVNDFYALMINDGLAPDDFKEWFTLSPEFKKNNKVFDGQIICWNKYINYITKK